MTYKLHGAALSPFVRKTRAFLLEKGQDYQAIHVDPFNIPPGYETLNPLKRIPALEDGDLKLADSAIICAYLEKKHPTPALYPATAYALARCLWFEKFADYEIAPHATFCVFRQRLLMPLFGKTCREEKVQEALTEKLPPLLDYLEKELGTQEFLAGNQFTVADIALASQWVNLEHGGEAIFLDAWPALKAHRDRLHARASFTQLLAGERRFVSQFQPSKTSPVP